jgi:hypothetical protein
MKTIIVACAVLGCVLFGSHKGYAYEKVDATGCMVSGCHTSATLHAVSSHAANCAQCHTSASGGGEVSSSRCIVCHPANDAGQCNLVKKHSSANCTSCHADCKSTCVAAQVLGDEDPRLGTLRNFRDKVLAKSVFGKQIIKMYYNNEGAINAALQKNPTLKAFTYKALQSFISAAEIFM